MTRLLIALFAVFGAANAAAQDVPPDPSDDVEAAEGDDGDVDVIADDGAPADPPAVDAPEAEADAPESDAPKAESEAPEPDPAPSKDADKADDADDGDPDEDVDPADDGDADDADPGDVDDDAKASAKKPAATDPLSAFRAGEYAKARDAWIDRLDERPSAPALHYRIAVSAALAEDPTRAEKHAATVERLDPGNLKAQELAAAARVARTRAEPVKLAVTQAEQALRDGRLRSAERLAAAALTEDGADVGALNRIRGEALLALGRADEAANALETAAAAGHADPRLWLALGDAAKSVGDQDRAAYLYTLAAQGAGLSDPVVDAAQARRAALGKTSSRESKRTRRR